MNVISAVIYNQKFDDIGDITLLFGYLRELFIILCEVNKISIGRFDKISNPSKIELLTQNYVYWVLVIILFVL